MAVDESQQRFEHPLYSYMEKMPGLDLGLTTADKILTSMDDGFRIRSEISKEGVLYYEFPELVHRNQIGSGDEPTRRTD